MAVGDLRRIDLVVLALGCRDGSQHQRMSHLQLFRMRKQAIVDPAGKDGRFHRHHPRLRRRSDSPIQLAPARADLAFPVHTTGRVLHAIADRLLVNVRSDVKHIASQEAAELSVS